MSESIEQWNAKVVPRNTRRQRSSGDRKPGGAKPFKRAAKLYMEALELRQKYANDLSMLQMLINELPAYISRGHGHRRGYSACRENFYPRPSKYVPHQGKSECARRVFQSMSKADRAYIRSIERDVSAAGDLE